MLVSALPTMFATIPTAVRTKSTSTSVVLTATPMTVALEVPPVTLSASEPMTNAFIEVPPLPTITATAVTLLPATEVSTKPIHQFSLFRDAESTQSSQGSGFTLPICTRTVDPEVKSFIHSVIKSTPEAPIEVYTFPIIIVIALIYTPTTETPPHQTHIISPLVKTKIDGTQSAQGSTTGTIPHTTIAQGLLAKIGSVRHGIKHMLIDHFKNDH